KGFGSAIVHSDPTVGDPRPISVSRASAAASPRDFKRTQTPLVLCTSARRRGWSRRTTVRNPSQQGPEHPSLPFHELERSRTDASRHARGRGATNAAPSTPYDERSAKDKPDRQLLEAPLSSTAAGASVTDAQLDLYCFSIRDFTVGHHPSALKMFPSIFWRKSAMTFCRNLGSACLHESSKL